MVDWPPSLVAELAARRVVIFIGAGLSKVAAPNLPSWAGLLKEMAGGMSTKKDQKLVEKLVRHNRYLDAADLIYSQLQPAQRRTMLEQKFLINPVPQSGVYASLNSLDAKVCITTNYDQLIEKNFEQLSGTDQPHQVRTHTYDNLISDLRSSSRIILKIHGCITETTAIVLDRKSYFNAKAENPGIYETVKALCTVNTVFFLGYSMSDPDIQLVLEDINAKSKSDHTHFALVPKFEHPSIRDANKHTYNIEFVEYPKGRHELVAPALEDLVNTVVAERGSSGMSV